MAGSAFPCQIIGTLETGDLMTHSPGFVLPLHLDNAVSETCAGVEQKSIKAENMATTRFRKRMEEE
jgi:hypothetical protein